MPRRCSFKLSTTICPPNTYSQLLGNSSCRLSIGARKENPEPNSTFLAYLLAFSTYTNAFIRARQFWRFSIAPSNNAQQIWSRNVRLRLHNLLPEFFRFCVAAECVFYIYTPTLSCAFTLSCALTFSFSSTFSMFSVSFILQMLRNSCMLNTFT